MSYNKEIDYESKINEAVGRGDYESAAEYEQSRNEKIDGEGLNYEKTNRYSGWLDKTDYSNLLKKQMSYGAPRSTVSETLKKRIEKASGTEGLTQYTYDDVYDEAIRYIMNGAYERPTYENSYQSSLDKLIDKFMNAKKFSYDPYKDELYEFYKKQYNREGELAMEDLLGEIAASTGGIASSYAVSAAAQARENYNKKLTDIIPKLYEDAYERYLDSIGLDEKALEILFDVSDREYERYIDSAKMFETDREFDYNREADKDEQSQDKVNLALKKWQNLGYLDAESAEILGLPAGLHTTDYDYKKAQQYKIYNN